MNDKPVTTARRWMKRITSALLLSCALPAAHAADTQPYNAGMRLGAIAYRQVSMPVALTYPTRAEAVAPLNPAPAGQERIELARAYIDLGDVDTARSLLQEVADAGDAAARGEAARLLRELV